MTNREERETKLKNGWSVISRYDYIAKAWWTFAIDVNGLQFKNAAHHGRIKDALKFHKGLVGELESRSQAPERFRSTR